MLSLELKIESLTEAIMRMQSDKQSNIPNSILKLLNNEEMAEEFNLHLSNDENFQKIVSIKC